jgi:hypothetical protein
MTQNRISTDLEYARRWNGAGQLNGASRGGSHVYVRMEIVGG